MNQPGAIFVQTTTVCNGKCSFCPHSKTYGRFEPNLHMKQSVWDKIVRDIQRWDYAGQVGLYLHGEPLANPGIFDKIRDVKERTDAHVVMSSNGTLLHKANRRKLIEAGPRRIHINVPSSDPVEYGVLTGLSFIHMVDSVRSLIKEADGCIDVEVVCLQTPDTVSDGLAELFPGARVKTDYWACSRAGLVDKVSAAGHRTCFNEQDHCVQATQNLCVLHDGSIIACANDWAGETRDIYPNVKNATLEEIYALVSARTHKFPMCAACIEEHSFCES